MCVSGLFGRRPAKAHEDAEQGRPSGAWGLCVSQWCALAWRVRPRPPCLPPAPRQAQHRVPWTANGSASVVLTSSSRGDQLLWRDRRVAVGRLVAEPRSLLSRRGRCRSLVRNPGALNLDPVSITKDKAWRIVRHAPGGSRCPLWGAPCWVSRAHSQKTLSKTTLALKCGCHLPSWPRGPSDLCPTPRGSVVRATHSSRPSAAGQGAGAGVTLVEAREGLTSPRRCPRALEQPLSHPASGLCSRVGSGREAASPAGFGSTSSALGELWARQLPALRRAVFAVVPEEDGWGRPRGSQRSVHKTAGSVRCGVPVTCTAANCTCVNSDHSGGTAGSLQSIQPRLSSRPAGRLHRVG
ncbi:PREDICTED: uncharacterized protein LOC102017529 [Chinchilla lanigera]|uniref:uncharacterized protein LOC102017529 n=1 Tax=Chinchilla lanigera TaxID=34839 RepID=UPI00069608F4|nr:PREDICTED: uncharacterized protein LOC102017529 [Chinchilla lanigera]